MGVYRVTQVSCTLRLSSTDCNKCRGIIGAGRSREATGSETPFVEIDPVVMNQALGPDVTAAWMELERPDGLHLRSLA